MGDAGRRGTKDLALEGAAMRPGRGLVFGVGGFDRRPDPTCQTDLCRQTLLVTPMPYSTIQQGMGGPWPGSACGLSPGGRKEGREREREISLYVCACGHMCLRSWQLKLLGSS